MPQDNIFSSKAILRQRKTQALRGRDIGRAFKKNRYLLAVSGLAAFVILANLIWITLDKRPIVGNGLTDLFPAFHFYLDVKNCGFSPLNFYYYFSIPTYLGHIFFTYPPLAPLSYSLTYFLFGIESEIEAIVNSIYLALAILAIYGIGKIIFNRKTGLLAAFIFSSFPGIISLSRQTFSEFILMCMTTVSFFLLLKTDYFKNTKYSILLGVSLGLTALAKWELPVTFTIPLLIFIWRAFNSCGPFKNKAVLRNLLFVVLVSVVIAYPWYTVNFQHILGRFFSSGEEAFYDDDYFSSLYLLKKFTYYAFSIGNIFISPFYFFLLIISIVILLYKFIKDKKYFSINDNGIFYALVLFSWVAVSYLVYSSFRLIFSSHIMPVVPPLAIIISAGIFAVRNRPIRYLLLSLVLLYGLAAQARSFIGIKAFDALCYNFRLCLDKNGKFSLGPNICHDTRDSWQLPSRYSTPQNEGKKIKEVMDLIKSDSNDIGRKPVILVLSFDEDFSPWTFQYYNVIHNYKFFIEPKGNDHFALPPEPVKFDYVLFYLSSRNEGIRGIFRILLDSLNIRMDPRYRGIDKFHKAFFNDYALLPRGVIYPPAGGKALIYKIKQK